MPKKAQDELFDYWLKWQKNPDATVVNGDELTEAERTKFIFLDNVSSGDWDWSKLDKWDADQLQDWGVGVEMPDFGDNSESESNLPPELQGLDLIPDSLEKLHGSDNTVMQRVIITFRAEQAKEVAEMLGVEEVEKILYKFDELK